MNDDEMLATRLREALHAEAESVRPAGDGLARIRERTQRRPQMAWWRPALAFATAAAVVTGAGVGVGALVGQDGGDGGRQTAVAPAETRTAPGQDPAAPTADDGPSTSEPTDPEQPTALEQPTDAAQAGPAEQPAVGEEAPTAGAETTPGEPGDAPLAGMAVPVYYVAEQPQGLRLFREFHRVPEGDRVRAAVEVMLRNRAADPDYRSLWPADATVEGVDTADGIATIELSAGPLGSGAEQELALQQLVHTVTAADNTVARVRVLVDGVPIGDDTMSRAPRLDVEGLLWLLSPVEGERVPSTFTVSGEAAAFEGTVQVQAIDAAGQVVAETFTTAEEGQRKTPFSTELTLPPGTYTIRVSDPGGAGDGEGGEAPYDSKTVTVG